MAKTTGLGTEEILYGSCGRWANSFHLRTAPETS